MQHVTNKQIYTVSNLNSQVKKLLEENFPFIWIIGEITNRYISSSGHCYFDLKDESAMIKAVIFKGPVKNLKFMPENGLEITGFGRISVYSPRGAYQMILEYIEPAGIGALQVAFEQLKQRLEKEGLFDTDKKLPLPILPGTIGVVTSLSGAVVHDIMTVLFRRFDTIRLIIAPTKVQGADAENEIVAALDMLNRHARADIIILARGGGSLEDLKAFNSEKVARAIHASSIPIVSAVGHEVDYTISDFSADFRAPTPSAAAEIIVPEKIELLNRLFRLKFDLAKSIQRTVIENRNHLKSITKQLINPRHRIEELHLRLDHLVSRLITYIRQRLNRDHHRTVITKMKLITVNPDSYISIYKNKNSSLYKNLLNLINMYTKNSRFRLNTLESTLTALNPMAILKRGYSITRTVDVKKPTIITNADGVKLNQPLEILLAKGLIHVTVQDKFDPGS